MWLLLCFLDLYVLMLRCWCAFWVFPINLITGCLFVYLWALTLLLVFDCYSVYCWFVWLLFT